MPSPDTQPEPENIQTSRWDWRSLAALLWLAGVVALYYVNHKPVTPAVAASLVRAALQFLTAWSLVSVGGGLGARWLSLPIYPPLVRLSLQAAFGLGLMSLAWLFIGVTVGVGSGIAWLALLAAAVLAGRGMSIWWQEWRDLRRILSSAGRLGKALGGGVVVILITTLLMALAPPVAYDALVYHLSLPRLYLEAGRILYVPEIMFWGMPQVGEMLYTWAMALAGPQAAAVTGWLVALLALTGILGFCAWRLSANAGWVAVASLLAGLTLSEELYWAYVDWFTILFGAAFFVALEGALFFREQKLLWLAGLFTGLAVGTKYTAGVLLIAGFVRLVWPGAAPSRRERVEAVSQYVLAAGIFMVPWMLRNLLATGNPVYPLLFPGGAMDQTRLTLYQGGPPWGSGLDFLFLPLRATLLGRQGAPGYNASIGPLLLGLGALAFLHWFEADDSTRAFIRHAALITGVILGIWMVAGRFTSYLLQSRLYLGGFPAMAALAAVGYEGLRQRRLPGVRVGRLAAVLILLVTWLGAFEVMVILFTRGALPVLVGQRTTNEYLQDNLGYYTLAMDAIESLPDSTRVMMLWEPRGYYCASRCEPDEILDRWLHDRAVYRTPEMILAAWQNEGFTHVLVYRLGADFLRFELQDPAYTLEDWQTVDVFLGQLSQLDRFGDAYELYQLQP